MDLERARREAEARRYRLQLRLALVERQARAIEDFGLLDRALALRGEVDGVPPSRRDAFTIHEVNTSSAALSILSHRVLGLTVEACLERHGPPLLKRWHKLALGSLPVLALLGGVGFIFARRREKARIDDEALARLEEGLNR